MIVVQRVVVQRVQIFWTKATRGAPRANERAALPRRFEIPVATENLNFHCYQMLEQNAFKVELTAHKQAPQIIPIDGSLVIEIAGAGLSLGLCWSSADGKPERYPRPGVVHLAKGQWAQLIMNGRHSNYSGQFYSEDIYNVAYGESIAANVFVTRAPDHTFSLAADLF